MILELKNIGILDQSEIQLNGLTVLTGHNNMGKSTVGKVAFALIQAVMNLEKRFSYDKTAFLSDCMDRMVESIEFPLTLRMLAKDGVESIFTEFLTKSYKKSENYPANVEAFFSSIVEALEGDGIIHYLNELIMNSDRTYKVGYFKVDNTLIDEKRKQALDIAYKSIDILNNDPLLINYARLSIDRSLNSEFNFQIQPLRKVEALSTIRVTNNDEVCFDLTIENNHVLKKEEPCFNSIPFNSVFFIDDISVIDSLDDGFNRELNVAESNSDSILSSSKRVYNHRSLLTSSLRRFSNMSIIEEIANNEKISKLNTKLNEVVPGNILLRDNGLFYVESEFQLRPSNLATGSKLFSVMKMILSRGAITDKTLLIIDEPEAHLHPAWQNAFAEVTTLLIKELGVTVLITTHSPNFMLALETNARKYDLMKISNFYQATSDEDGYVCHKCVNNDLSSIYYDFTKYFSEIKAARDAIMLNSEEIANESR